MKLKLLFIFLSAISCIEGLKILGVFYIPSYSHFQVGDVILKALAKKGHEVTAIASYAEKAPVKNFKTVLLTGMVEEYHKESLDMFGLLNMSTVSNIFFMSYFGPAGVEKALEHPNIHKLLKSDEKFDLVIMEQFFNEALHGFCYHYGTPCIVINSIPANSWITPQMGNPGSPAYVPELLSGYKSKMSFWQRANNLWFHLIGLVSMHFINYPAQNKLLQKHFPGAPYISELFYNTSLVLINSNAGLSNPVPLVPNMVEIGGYHIKNSNNTLPKELQDYLDGAKDGAIFFSMGSNLKSANIPPEKRDAILKVFSKLEKIKVLWKFEDENLPGKPDNVKISKWLPQADILAHPNVKLFISHGGFFSTIETVYYGVPIVGIPIYGDQRANVGNAENDGYGIKLDYNDVTEESLSMAINEVLNNPKYRENVKMRSRAFRDQQVKPLDKALFWIEYIFRHKGAPHLRTAALSLNWYQYLLLDVIGFLILVTITVFYIFSKLLKLVCSKKKSRVSAKKTN